MRVKLCARCPYTPRDLTGHYDPEATLHLCAKCDGEQGALTKRFPRETRWRRECSKTPNTFNMAPRSAVPSVTAGSVSSDTTAGELHSVQGSALIASRPDRRPTADGYAGFTPPEKQPGIMTKVPAE
jgi:hypothetical protein